jgi:hypothetical protein
MRSSALLLAATWGLVCCVGASRESHAQQSSPPERIVGRDECKKCHDLEYAAWEHSSHNTKAWQLLDHPKAQDFAKALGVSKEDIKGDSACASCHGTKLKKEGSLRVESGNSCESCHGGAGGPDGWLKNHYDFGLGTAEAGDAKMDALLKERSQESAAHRKARDAACKRAGMNRSEDAYEIVKNCLQCHIVADAKLAAAQHPMSEGFEFVEWAQGEVRHNFLLDRSRNSESPTNWLDASRNGPGRTPQARKRLMYLAGQLADLELSLRIRASATSADADALRGRMNDRILAARRSLEDAGSVAEIQPAINATQAFDRRKVRKVADDDKETYTKAADAVAKAAAAFVAAHQGGAGLPETIKPPAKVKGTVFTGRL